MKKSNVALTLILTSGLLLSACSSNSEDTSTGQGLETNQEINQNQTDQNKEQNNNQGNDQSKDPSKEEGSDQSKQDSEQSQENSPQSTQDMVDKLLQKVEQPAFIEMEPEMVESMYYIDPTLLEEYTILTPMINIKTNEIAILKVKDSKDLPAIEEGVKKRAEDVQKQFETYLPDQYENAKNYKLITEGEYVFFVISEAADQLEQEFNSFFEQ